MNFPEQGIMTFITLTERLINNSNQQLIAFFHLFFLCMAFKNEYL